MGGNSLSPFEVPPRYDELVLLVIVRRGERGRVGSSLSSSGVGKSLLRPNLLESELKADGLDGLRSGDSDTRSGIILLSRFLLRPSNVPSLFRPPLEPDFCFSGSEDRSVGAATLSVYFHHHIHHQTYRFPRACLRHHPGATKVVAKEQQRWIGGS